MPDSHPKTPVPSDHGLSPDPKTGQLPRSSANDESIDFSHHTPADEGGSGALSFHISRSGPLSGSSVIPWSALVEHPDEEEQGNTGRPEGDRDAGTDDVASDADLLRHVLAQEQPPSKIIKDPSADRAALRTASSAEINLDDDSLPSSDLDSNDDDATFRLRSVSISEDSSVLSGPATAGAFDLAGKSGSGSSSRVDILGARPSEQPTEQVFPRSGRYLGGDSSRRLADSASGDDLSSAVDLGSRQEVDIPFPLAVDSSVGSSLLGKPRRPGQRTDDQDDPDSATVDLLAVSSGEFELTPKGSSIHRFIARSDELPLTMPLAPAGRNRLAMWGGGALAGVVAGVGTYLILSFVNSAPERSGQATAELQARADEAASQARQARAESEALLAKLRQANIDPNDLTNVPRPPVAGGATDDAGRRAQADLDALTTKLRVANINPADLPTIAKQLERGQAAADEARRAQAALETLTTALTRANVDPADVPAGLTRLSQARAAAEAATSRAEAQVVRLREEATASAREAKAVEDRLTADLERAAAARAALAEFQTEVLRRLQATRAVPPTASPSEALATLDSALQRPTGGRASRPNAASAERQFTAGRQLYRAGDYRAAEQAFDAAVAANQFDARYLYFRGLCRWQLGRGEDAARDYAQAADLERRNLPYAQDIDLALERVQGASRQALNRYRP